MRTWYPVPSWNGVCLALLASVVLPSCGSPPSSLQVTVVDSAGIRVVQNAGIEGLEAWTLSRSPRFRLGWEDDDPTFEGLSAGTILPDGRFVVVDARRSEVLLLSPHGEIEAVFGRAGQGPGEFSDPSAVIHLAPDSILVHDAGLSKVAIFYDTGEFARESRLQRVSSGVRHTVSGSTTSGDLVLVPSAVGAQSTGEWLRAPVLLVSRDGSDTDTVISVDHMRLLNFEERPFQEFGAARASANGIVYGRNDRAEVRWIDLNGNTQQIARWEPDWREVDDEVWNEYSSTLLDRGGPELMRNRLRQTLERQRSNAPARLPLFRFFEVDEAGNVWLSEYTFVGSPARRYRIIAADGRWIGELELPENFRVLDIGEDVLLGVQTNEWDVQAVAVWELRKDG